MAFAPKFVLFLVPSSSRSKLSRAFWFNSLPIRAFLMIVFTLFTALVTPLPWYLESPSLSSRASFVPVEAPDGTLALTVKFSVVSSHSTVGFPLESRISLAYKFVIFIFHTFFIRKL